MSDLPELSHKEAMMRDDVSDALRSMGYCSSGIVLFTKILSGEKKTALRTLMIAQCEGRDYFSEIAEKRQQKVDELMEAAEFVAAAGLRVRRMEQYRAWADGRF